MSPYVFCGAAVTPSEHALEGKEKGTIAAGTEKLSTLNFFILVECRHGSITPAVALRPCI